MTKKMSFRRIAETLGKNMFLLEKSINTLDYSYHKCYAIGLKTEYSPDELESFESLTSRFARTADILTQKVIRSLLIYLQEDTQTFFDMANALEKFGIIENANTIVEIRELRNEISHEYNEDDIHVIFNEVFDQYNQLIKIADNLKIFVAKKNLL